MNPSDPSFSARPPAQRVALLLDHSSFEAGPPAGSLLWGAGRIDQHRVYLAATDPRVARGAIGVEEARGLSEMLIRARSDDSPVVLLLDSSGARVDEGLRALGAFRGLFREALLTRLAGVPMLALLGRACFGGASMLACLCARRYYLASTRLATSGPAVIEAVVGKAHFDAGNKEQVMALMCGTERARIDPGGVLMEDSEHAAGASLRGWLAEAAAGGTVWQPQFSHALLAARLREAELFAPTAVMSSALKPRLDALLPAGYAPSLEGEVFFALPSVGSRKPLFLGTLSGSPVGAATCWQLAERLLKLDEYVSNPVVLVLDADGHAASIVDERMLLSAYIVHLSLAIALASTRAHHTVLWIMGKASGASYVAFASAVDWVSVLPSARIEILPALAARQIVGGVSPEAPVLDSLLHAGVADAVLDTRLSAYREIGSTNR